MKDEAAAARQHMLESCRMYSDEMMELLLAEEEVPHELIHSIVKAGVQQQDVTPVFMGTAYRNKGVQPLLDAVVRYLPSPLDRKISAKNHNKPDEKFPLEPDPDKPFVGMAFKIVEDPYGQLTFVRIYQGTINKGDIALQPAHRPEAPLQPHPADARRQARGNRQRRRRRHRGHHGHRLRQRRYVRLAESKYCTLESMFVAEPVIKMAITPIMREGADKLAKALQRFMKEDPTFRVSTDEETGETLIAGMGELHLDIYVERIRREYKVDVEVGAPKVSYREAPTKERRIQLQAQEANRRFGPVRPHRGHLRCLPEDAPKPFEFEDKVIGGRIPKEYIPSVEKGFRDSLHKGPLAGFPIVGVKTMLEDGSYHDVDSSDMAFQICARDCFRETFLKMKPALLEPIMKLEVEVPDDLPRLGHRRSDQPPRHDRFDRNARQSWP